MGKKSIKMIVIFLLARNRRRDILLLMQKDLAPQSQWKIPASGGQAIHTTRRAVLDALRASGQASINELAEGIGVKAITIRHHLNGLQAEGLVEVEEKRQSVGRPLHVY